MIMAIRARGRHCRQEGDADRGEGQTSNLMIFYFRICYLQTNDFSRFLL